MSNTLQNVIWIGDSLSIGMTPVLAANLSARALVQHSPWDVHDGGAEETEYGLRCLNSFLHSPSGMELRGLDLIMFNWGMHDGPMSNRTTPGQNGPAVFYATQLAQIADNLVAYSKSFPAGEQPQLLFVATTPYLCDATSNGAVQSLNNVAEAIMSARGIPVVSS